MQASCTGTVLDSCFTKVSGLNACIGTENKIQNETGVYSKISGSAGLMTNDKDCNRDVEIINKKHSHLGSPQVMLVGKSLCYTNRYELPYYGRPLRIYYR